MLNEEAIARICHEANAAYCASIGDYSQQPWNAAQKWQQDSAIAGVRAALADQNITPEQMHQKWLEMKLSDGWRYGKEKDVSKKEHPCCVSYANLPEEQKVKDKLFMAIVKVFV